MGSCTRPHCCCFITPLIALFLLLVCFIQLVDAGTVSYDHRALLLDGQRKLFISGSIHYPRSTPQMWSDLVSKAKDGGLNVIDTYVFWNVHEPTRGTYNFEGRFDLVGFIKVVQQAGLYVILRIGPYACAEWNYGGFPAWLHFIPGIEFRTNNEAFKSEMERFTAKIVEMMKEEKLLYTQGGPIIVAQIENEYGNIDSSYGEAGKAYIKWAAEMAVGLNTGVPWVMCQQSDAPDPVINTCNGFYCDAFTPNSDSKPTMWTENWSGWFQTFGGPRPHRPTQDVAFAVAGFYERGGTFQNYYMYHGGTNFGRSSGGPFITTSYDYDAPLDEYGNINQPKWGHLKELHEAINLCERALVLEDPTRVALGSMQEAHIYTNGADICAAFLANFDSSRDATVNFEGGTYNLPAWSVSILPDCKKVVFNTAQINSQTTILTTSLASEELSADQMGLILAQGIWQIYQEPIGDRGEGSFTSMELLEQINTTKDASDYLWYSTSVLLDSPGDFALSIGSLGHALHVFVNQEFSGSVSGRDFQKDFPLSLNMGSNKIDLLSMTVGLQNYGAFFDTWGAGLTSVALRNSENGGSMNLSSQTWVYQVGLQGETMDLFSDSGSLSGWTSVSEVPRNQPMVWYKTTLDAPEGDDPVVIDLTSMGKGRAWVNGEDIGRFWPTNVSPQTGCSGTCVYQGAYSANKCFTNCGEPSQSRYHVPRSWLKDSGNTLVLFEEIGGDPTKISFVTSSVSSVCTHVGESHAPPVSAPSTTGEPVATIDCGASKIISSIIFASYGTPEGACGSFQIGSCHATTSLETVQQACVGQRACSVTVSNSNFQEDPCAYVIKSLAIEAQCS